MVSKTRSKRNSGFWYGFFPARGLSGTVFLSVFASSCIRVRVLDQLLGAAGTIARGICLSSVYNRMNESEVRIVVPDSIAWS
jgi:hypothetical protein